MSVNGILGALGAPAASRARRGRARAALSAGAAVLALGVHALWTGALAAPVISPVIKPARSEAPETVPAPSEKKAASRRPGLRDRALPEYADWDRAGPTGQIGATDRIGASDYLDNYINDAGEAFFFAPGAYVNALDANEPRIVLRGFDVKNRQERATAPVFRDGAPLTDVHGTTNLREIDLRAVSHVEVMRGGGGDLRLAGDNLGGVVNFVSPTGRDLGDMRLARGDVGVSIEGNPGGRVHAALAGVSGGERFDYFVSLSGGYETGFRENNDLQDAILNANVGYSFSDTFVTRFFIDGVYSEARQGGGLSLEQLEDDPFQATPPITLGPLFPGGPIIEFADGFEEAEVGRDLFVGRIANQTNFRLLGHDVEAGFHFARRDVESPQINFIGVIDESGNEWGARLALKRLFHVFGMEAEYRVGGAYAVGEQSSDRFENLNGDKSDQTIDSDHRSSNLNAFAEAAFRPLRRLLVDIGAKLSIVDRELTTRDVGVFDDDAFEELRFTGVAARGGAVYRITDDIEIFANAARTYEPPSFSELISDNPLEFNELEEQDSFGFEGGFRGRLNDWASWDIAYFNTDVENEIVNIDDPDTNGIGGVLVNFADTTHKGFEVGLDLTLFPSRFGRDGGGLTWRSAYSYNDFRIVDAGDLDDDIDGNRLASVPEHLYRGEIRYDAGGQWYAAANVEIGAGSFFVDHENVVSAPTYAALGFTAGLRLSDQIEVFASGRNLTDNAYAAGVSPVLSQTTQDARLFTPANRASVFAGMTYRF